MDISTIKVDTDAIENGAWVTDIPEMGDVSFKVRGASSKAFTEHMAALSKKIPRSQRDRRGNPLPEVARGLMVDGIVDVLLLDWKGLTENGKPLPFSKDRARKLLSDPAFAPLRNAVNWAVSSVGAPAGGAIELVD